jgi:hypothetical protein
MTTLGCLQKRKTLRASQNQYQQTESNYQSSYETRAMQRDASELMQRVLGARKVDSFGSDSRFFSSERDRRFEEDHNSMQANYFE